MAEKITVKRAVKHRKFVWEKRKVEAAALLAEGEMTLDQIAEAVGCSARQLDHWKKREEFAARIKYLMDEMEVAALRKGIARKFQRLNHLDARHKKLCKVIEDRAADMAGKGIPGGETGLVVRQLKAVGKGEDFQLIEEYVVDTGTLAELRAHEKQAAMEIQDWVEKRELAGAGGGPIQLEMTVEQRTRIEAALIARLGGTTQIPNGHGQAGTPRLPLGGPLPGDGPGGATP